MMEREIVPVLAWYALYTKSRHEFKVLSLLEQKEYTAYLPSVEKSRQWRNRKKKIVYPLFPGYIFIKCTMEKQKYYDILTTHGIVKVVGKRWPDLPRIPEKQVESIQTALRSRLPVTILAGVQKGDLIRVKSGILMGIEGTLVQKSDNNSCISISIDSLHRCLEVKIDCQQVEIEKIG